MEKAFTLVLCEILCPSLPSIAVIKHWPKATWGGKVLFHFTVLRSHPMPGGAGWVGGFLAGTEAEAVVE